MASVNSTLPERVEALVRSMARKISGVKTYVPQPRMSVCTNWGFSSSETMRFPSMVTV